MDHPPSLPLGEPLFQHEFNSRVMSVSAWPVLFAVDIALILADAGLGLFRSQTYGCAADESGREDQARRNALVGRSRHLGYCPDFRCSRSTAMSADRWPDHVSALERSVMSACARLGMRRRRCGARRWMTCGGAEAVPGNAKRDPPLATGLSPGRGPKGKLIRGPVVCCNSHTDRKAIGTLANNIVPISGAIDSFSPRWTIAAMAG